MSSPIAREKRLIINTAPAAISLMIPTCLLYLGCMKSNIRSKQVLIASVDNIAEQQIN